MLAAGTSAVTRQSLAIERIRLLETFALIRLRVTWCRMRIGVASGPL